MTITMDQAGRLVIPAEIRREAAIEPGVPLDVRLRDGVIEIQPQPVAVIIQRRGRLLVASPVTKAPSLTHETVERTRRAVRKSRR